MRRRTARPETVFGLGDQSISQYGFPERGDRVHETLDMNAQGRWRRRARSGRGAEGQGVLINRGRRGGEARRGGMFQQATERADLDYGNIPPPHRYQVQRCDAASIGPGEQRLQARR